MKKQLPALVAIIVVIALVVLSWAALSMKSPAQALQDDMAPELETAQRILANYSPDSGFLADALRQHEDSGADPDAPIPPDVQAALDSLDQLGAEHDRALSGAPSFNWRDKYPSDLPGTLREESEALEKALTSVTKAMSMTAGSGADAVSGRTDPVATQLKATLLYEQADLLRRRAGYEHDLAEKAQHDFRSEYTRWRESDAMVRSLEHRLQGGTSPGATDHGDAPSASDSPADPKASATQDTGSPLTPAPLRTIDERKAEVTQQISALEPAIAESQERVADLEEQVATVRARLEEVVRTKKDAQSRMFALEEQKLDPLDDHALERFTKEYESTAEVYRQAEKEAQLLEHGGYRNATIGTDDEEQLLSAPLESVQPGEGLKRVDGLIALETELQAARDVLQAEITLRNELEGQQTALDHEKTQIQEELISSTQLRSTQRDNALTFAIQAMKKTIEAYRYETDAIDICTNSGPAAVSAAKNAASTAMRDINEFMQKQPPAAGGSARVDFLPDYIALLEADFAYQLARLEAQRSRSLENHAELLARTEAMGIGTSSLLGEGTDPSTVDPALLSSEAARKAADNARERVQIAANETLTRLEEVQRLNEKWFVGAARAAVKYLLAQNARTPEEAEALRQEALDLYRRIPTEASDAQKLQPVIEGLSSTQP